MSDDLYLHELTSRSITKGKKVTTEEKVIHGAKGLHIKYYHKENDAVEKIVINGSGDNFVLKTIVGDKTEEKTLKKAELIKEVGKNKKLKFASEYVNAPERELGGGQRKGHGKKSTKKGSKKKSSRKGSKKDSKKGK